MEEQSSVTTTEPSGSVHPARPIHRIRKRDGTLVPFDQEKITQAIFKAMPKMLADGGQRSVKEEMRKIIEGMTARTWKRHRERLLDLVRSL